MRRRAPGCKKPRARPMVPSPLCGGAAGAGDDEVGSDALAVGFEETKGAVWKGDAGECRFAIVDGGVRCEVQDAGGTEREVDVGGTFNGRESGEGDDRDVAMRCGQAFRSSARMLNDGVKVTSFVVRSRARASSGESSRWGAVTGSRFRRVGSCCFQARSATVSRNCLATAVLFGTKVRGALCGSAAGRNSTTSASTSSDAPGWAMAGGAIA